MFHARSHYLPEEVVWNEETVTQTIKTIVDSVVFQAESGGKWQKHKLDDGGQIKSDFYFGRGGSLWAVDYLQRSGAVKS